jgi:hypothetical protein
MKKVLVKGYLYVALEGTSIEYHFHSTSVLPVCSYRLVMPCNFEVLIPDAPVITPVTMFDAVGEEVAA